VRDLYIFERMTEELEAYLDSNTLIWELSNANMPKLTLGGCLMRHNRLHVLKDSLQPAESMWLYDVAIQFNKILAERVVKTEKRAHEELHARTGEWIRELQRFPTYMLEGWQSYADVVDTRVVMDALTRFLQMSPYQLDQKLKAEVEMFDTNLRKRWEHGTFVWPVIWQPAYPADEYWWLYGQLKAVVEPTSV
ncbi:MAG: hypothetical protein KDE51_01620, partial [Anaerolineales bacterium]|nr:hypothetical protein [Anaerolineales bacterium]